MNSCPQSCHRVSTSQTEAGGRGRAAERQGGQSSSWEDTASQLTGPPWVLPSPSDLDFPLKIKMWLGSLLRPSSAQAPETRQVPSEDPLHPRTVSWRAGGE